MEQIIITVIIAIIVFFIVRNLMLWYYRIDTRVRLLEQNNKLLTMLVAHNLGISETEVTTKVQAEERGIFISKVLIKNS